DIEITTHGCGENFPVDESGVSLDTTAEDSLRDPLDRRVELFFFDSEFGIVPPPPGKNSGPGSSEYLAWRKAQLIDSIDLVPSFIAVECVDESGKAIADVPFELS